VIFTNSQQHKTNSLLIMQNPVIIVGAQKLGVAALDAFSSNNVVVYCFLDDDATLQQTEVNDIAVMGGTEEDEILRILGKKCEVFVATEDAASRKSLTSSLKEKYQAVPVNAIHRASYVSEHAWLGHGNLIGAGAVLNPNSKLGDSCVIQARAVIDSGAELADFVQVGPGAIINNDVKIGEGAYVGTGAIVVSGIKIGKKARVGAGSLVVADVADGQTVFGNPAQVVK
jgi:sugar O-acyltransferase (sialic acid O-acetyltransferase NeuD family)